MFNVSCPAGWTRFAEFDGRFPIAWKTYMEMWVVQLYIHMDSGSLAVGSHVTGAGSYVFLVIITVVQFGICKR